VEDLSLLELSLLNPIIYTSTLLVLSILLLVSRVIPTFEG